MEKLTPVVVFYENSTIGGYTKIIRREVGGFKTEAEACRWASYQNQCCSVEMVADDKKNNSPQ